MGTEVKQRDTKQRRLVLQVVRDRYDHPTADDIYDSVHAIDSRISKGTVYRNLNILADNGEIRHVRVPGADRFDRTTEKHFHIQCTECGKVEDVPIDYMKEYDEVAARATGYRIKRHLTVFLGVCSDCQKKEETQ